jgi:three-Cys-motif partner protein
MTQEKSLYVGREQTRVKHLILQRYLGRFAHIVGKFWEAITYVDCFSGPWSVRSGELRDSSFFIALEELRKARATLASRGQRVKLRCMFLEKSPSAYQKLKEFADSVTDAEVETRNSELAGAVGDILEFIKSGGRKSFPFIFIDPTGWRGFEMQLIAPLLRCRPGEVLINFMTDYIRRFIESPDKQTQESFAALFGSGDYKARIQGLSDEQDREDALFRAYAENVQKTGAFTYTCAAIVLYPESDRSYFHLIYATRDRKGVEVFKDVEKRATYVMEQERAEAQKRKREKKTGQRELFSGEVLHRTRRIEDLRERYLAQARQKVVQLLQTKGRVPYEETWDLALSVPLVWESDLKDWIRDWKATGDLKLQGLKHGQRVPRRDRGIVLLWQGPAQP